MRESSGAWQYLERHTPPHIHIERVEVKYPPGLADCFWHDREAHRSGWLELKYCEHGDREYVAGRIPKLQKTQPLWLNRMARVGVPAGILERIGSVDPIWKLFVANGNPEWANILNSTKAQDAADFVWRDGLDATELFDLLVAMRG